MTLEVYSRLKSVGLKYGTILSLALSYIMLCRFVGHGLLPCPFRLLTGLECPGCGSTRMFMALVDGDINGAFAANPALLAALPVLVAIVFYDEWRWVKSAERVSPPPWLTAGLLIYFLIFGIVRNLPLQ